MSLFWHWLVWLLLLCLVFYSFEIYFRQCWKRVDYNSFNFHSNHANAENNNAISVGKFLRAIASSECKQQILSGFLWWPAFSRRRMAKLAGLCQPRLSIKNIESNKLRKAALRTWRRARIFGPARLVRSPEPDKSFMRVLIPNGEVERTLSVGEWHVLCSFQEVIST